MKSLNGPLFGLIDGAIKTASSLSQNKNDQWAKCVEALMEAKSNLVDDTEPCKCLCGVDFFNRCHGCDSYKRSKND